MGREIKSEEIVMGMRVVTFKKKELSELSDEQLKSIIRKGIENHRNPNHHVNNLYTIDNFEHPKLKRERDNVGFEILRQNYKLESKEESERVDSLYEEVLSSFGE